tara:strand:+ start:1003 stop:1215 length:213 start_codon:yes stop_codon:yes gene_type:complete
MEGVGVRIIVLGLIIMMTSACSVGTISGKDVIRSINIGKNISKITTAGVKEEATNCVKDIFDPSNRGSGC